MKEILDVYQKDWATTPSKADIKPESFKNSTVLIAGHEIARCIAYTLLMLNDRIKLNVNVILAGTDEAFGEKISEGVAQREDFTYTALPRIGMIKQDVDYIVYTGMCGVEFNNQIVQTSTEIYNVKNVVEFAKTKKVKKVIMLSHSDVYGKGENKYRAFSEMEFGNAEGNLFVELIRTSESIFVKRCDDYNLDSVILRAGVVLGASSGIYNGLDNVFKAVAENKTAEIYSTPHKVSFIYLSDLFNAIVFVTEKKLRGIYNVAGENSTVSTGMLSAILHDVFDDVNIKTIDDGIFRGACLNCEKIKLAGFKPTISLQTALELCVLSYKTNDENLKFPHEHEGRLNAIQQLLLGYLLEVDRICRKHNVTYYLGGGTLLGAARHNGFIPWDDDVDIMMLREDYDRFLEIAPSELPEGMVLQDPKKDKNSFYCYAKLRLKDTVFCTDFSKNHKDTENGFAFDIFCHDKTANSKIGQKLHSRLTLFWLAMVFNKWNNRRVDNGKKFQSAICNFLKNIFPLRFSMFMLLRTLEMFKHKKNAKYLYDGMGYSVAKGGFDKSFVDNEIRVDFEGHKLPVPEKYKEYLTNHYGDYMELAPLSTRLLSHEITVCDLGKYSNFKISNENNRMKK